MAIEMVLIPFSTTPCVRYRYERGATLQINRNAE